VSLTGVKWTSVMEKALRDLPTMLILLISFRSVCSASTEPETRMRVTIRGTGSEVSVDRGKSPAAAATRPELSRRASPTTALSEAIHMKEAKASDALVVSYLRENAARLPIVVDLDTVHRLRAAGAGKPVLAYLASVSAIEVGDSGAVGGGPDVAYSSPAEAPEEPGFAAPYGYAVIGGYASAPLRRPRFHSIRPSEGPRFRPAEPFHRIPPPRPFR